MPGGTVSGSPTATIRPSGATARSTRSTRSNVNRLGLAWTAVAGEGGGNQEATPLFWNGVLYGITNWSIVFAIDARTGQGTLALRPQGGSRVQHSGSQSRHLLRRRQPRDRAPRREGARSGDRRPDGGARREVRSSCGGPRASSRKIRPATRSRWRRAWRRTR